MLENVTDVMRGVRDCSGRTFMIVFLVERVMIDGVDGKSTFVEKGSRFGSYVVRDLWHL